MTMLARAVLRPLLIVALFLAAPGALLAQAGSTTDIITGRVLGPAGMPVAGAQVEAVSLETQTRRRTITNNQGRYTIIFPDGGGRFAIQVNFIGMSPSQFVLARQADEEVLVADVQLQTDAIEIQGIEVTARRTPGDRIQREPGGQERVLSGEALNRLPIDPEDFAAIAGLTPGVVGLEGADTLGLGAGFSIMGQRPDLNSITMDGMSFGSMMGGGMDGGVPQEAVRMTRVITNTYDVARGQFAGGQIATTTRRGTNRTQGSFSYLLRDPALQWSMPGTIGEGTAQHRFSGGGGGPIVRDRLFYFGSVSATRRTSPFQTLNTLDPTSLERLGLSPDARTSFFDIVQDRHGIPLTLGPTLTDRTTDSYVLLGRLDMRLNDRHTLMVRGDGRISQQDGLRAGPLGLPQNGGEMESQGVGAMAMLTSHLGTGWINEFRAYLSQQDRSSEPYVYLPEGRVRISSELADGARG
ncbi:MAG: carboxypeptidase regulatory-like domain-containing protein, partial [Gemmatimonadetes bacterium]|nr:carboxypeptidase regulatory-like domain-containing protein [Gemmatimonadota bacterium]